MSDPSKLSGVRTHAPIWFQNLIAPFAFGHLAVASFIVISGYCLQLSLFSSGNGRIKSIPNFLWRRAKRILPPYYGCLFISTWVAINVTSRIKGMPFEMYLPVNTPTILAHVFLIHNWSVGWMYKLNGVLWSIAIEAQLYLIFPLIVITLFKFGRWWTMLAATLAAVVVLQYDPGALKLYPWYLPLFVLGMTSAHLAFVPNFLVRSTVLPRLAGFTCFIAVINGISNGWNLPVTDACIGGWVACLCHSGTVGKPSFVVRLFSLRPLVALGAFSYSLYLIHHPIQQLLFWYRPGWANDEVGKLTYFMESLPVILLGAWLFSLVFERPFMSRRRKNSVNKGPRIVALPLVSAIPSHSAGEEADASAPHIPATVSP
jgi:peptidoglycan/LPS O-acetylase OafA/YrhL